MGAIETFRDALFGNPPQANMKPSREGALAAFTEAVKSINSIVGGIFATDAVAVYATRNILVGHLEFADRTLGVVYADSDPDKVGIYIKNGAPGSGGWTFTGLLGRGPGPTENQIYLAFQTYVDQIAANVSSAIAAAAQAELSAGFAEEFAGPAYDSVEDGENATDVGHFFRVAIPATDPVEYDRYQRTPGGSVEAAPLATTAALASADEDKGASLVAIERPLASARKQTARDILLEQVITPDTFRQPGDTVLERLQRFGDALGDGVHGRLDADYEIPSMVTVGWKSKFKLDGMGYTIKLANGAATGYGGSALYFVGCTDFEVTDLICDGNRDNRVPAEDPAHVIVVDKCHRWKFRDVEANNGTCDGFLIYAGSNTSGSGPGGAIELDDCPSDWLMEDCRAVANWRQGMSIIEAFRGKVRRGRYGLTAGAWDEHSGPCAGIDIEPDNQPTWVQDRVADIDIDDVRFDQNDGAGLLITNINGVKNIRVRDCVFDSNKKAAIETFGESVDIIRPKVIGWNQDDYTDNPDSHPKRGAIDIGTGAGRTRIVEPEFQSVENPVGNANPCIYVHGTAADGIEISGIRSDGSASDILVGNAAKMNVHDNVVDLTGATAGTHFTMNGPNPTFHRNKLFGIYGRAMYAAGEGARIVDNEFYVRFYDGTAFIVDTEDAALAEVRGNYVELDVAGDTLGIRVPENSRLIDNNIANITTGRAWSPSAETAIVSRGNTRGDHKLPETALAS